MLDQVALSTKATASLIGLSLYTLQRARHDRADLDVPPASYRGRHVFYRLADVLAWSRRRGRPLHWQALPWSFAVPAADALASAGLAVPVDLQRVVRR